MRSRTRWLTRSASPATELWSARGSKTSLISFIASFFKNFHAKLFDLVKFPHHVFYGAGKNVDATDNKHIIHAAQHATLQQRGSRMGRAGSLVEPDRRCGNESRGCRSCRGW